MQQQRLSRLELLRRKPLAERTLREKLAIELAVVREMPGLGQVIFWVIIVWFVDLLTRLPLTFWRCTASHTVLGFAWRWLLGDCWACCPASPGW